MIRHRFYRKAVTLMFVWMMLMVIGIFPAAGAQEEKGVRVSPQILDEPVTPSTLSYADLPSREDSSEDEDLPLLLIHGNKPDFYIWQITDEAYVSFSPLDELGRTGPGMACLGADTLPAEPRGQIGDIRPSGWQLARYDDRIEDKYLYNRSHVLGYQLCGDNATPENLFTGTRYLNSETMLYFEDQVAAYLNADPAHHVIYRVSPVYNGKDPVAAGVQMEAFSVEDYGQSVCFNVFLYNIQPGVSIDYSTGDSHALPDYDPGKEKPVSIAHAYQSLTAQAAQAAQSAQTQTVKDAQTAQPQPLQAKQADEAAAADRSIPAAAEAKETELAVETEKAAVTYILNTNTRKFHYPGCSSVSDMKDRNKAEFTGSREEAISAGYSPCGRCHP